MTSNSRAAQLEAENRDIRIKVASLSTLLQEFCSRTKNLPEKNTSDENNQQTESFNLAEAVTQLENSLILIQNTMPQSDSKDTATHSKSFENVQLQVKMELEHERRLRTQMALGRLRRNFEKPNFFYLRPFSNLDDSISRKKKHSNETSSNAQIIEQHCVVDFTEFYFNTKLE